MRSKYFGKFVGLVLGSAVFAGMTAIAGVAAAETTHVVGRGHTLQAIANRYHVSVKAIEAANPSVNPKHLKIGETLTIPTTGSSGSGSGSASTASAAAHHERGRHESHAPATYAARPKQPHVVHAVRLNTGEAFTVTTTDRRGHVPAPSLKSMENLMKSSGNLAHSPDARLIALFGVVSDHFGGRKIEVVSGFRPYTPTQHTPHSNHNVGKAIDFRVVGVPNEVLRDFCHTLHNVGCGYYPNSTFVHMDVRATSATWVDYSRPGEAPKYDAPGSEGDADDSTSDVAEETSAQAVATSPNNIVAAAGVGSGPAAAANPNLNTSPSESTGGTGAGAGTANPVAQPFMAPVGAPSVSGAATAPRAPGATSAPVSPVSPAGAVVTTPAGVSAVR